MTNRSLSPMLLPACLSILIAGCAAVPPRPCDVGLKSDFLDVPIRPGGFDLLITAGGGVSHPVQVDTGSTGIAIRRDTIGTYTPARNGLPGYIYYNSSGNLLCGEWVRTEVTLTGGSVTVVIPDMDVLAVDHECTVHKLTADSCGQCTQPLPATTPQGKRDFNPAMLGVGFDRGVGMGTAEQNPFLQLPAMRKGKMQRGYVITTEGIRLGMRQEEIEDFLFIGLEPVSKPVTPYDWQQAPGCVSIDGGGVITPGQQTCGSVLMDTGVDRMYLSYRQRPPFDPPLPALPPLNDLWRCCLNERHPEKGIEQCVPGQPQCTVNGGGAASVTVSWPSAANPVNSWTATAPQAFASNGTSPIFAKVNDQATPPQGDVFVNTSRQLLYEADYLYDATCGRIGFRKKRND